MKLRTKATIFFATLFIVVTSLTVIFIENVVGGAFKKQIANDFFVIAEQSEGTYFAFLEGIKARVADWSSDSKIVSISKGIISAGAGTYERTRLANEFAAYISKSKMPFDETVKIVDLLDKNGIVVASTESARIGIDELKEELEFEAHHFSKSIVSPFNSPYIKSFVFEQDKEGEPMTHATTRIFDIGADGIAKPVDAVLLTHFANTKNLASALGVDVEESEVKDPEGRVTSMALLKTYKTSDIYLVDRNGILVTPSRYMKNVTLRPKVDTLPVRKCVDNGKEVISEYENFLGNSVLGASMCIKNDGLVLIVEIHKDEIFAPLDMIKRFVVAGGIILATFGILITILFIRIPLKRIDEVISALERVMNGDFSFQVPVRAKDETGRLATMFNTMIESIRTNQKKMKESKFELEEMNLTLEKDVEEHKEQEKFLEESKRATLNLLEDSWNTKEKLEEEGSRLQTILASIEDGLVLIDNEYKIVLVNAKALQIFAMSLTDLLGKDMRDVAKLCRQKVNIEPGQWPTEEVLITKKSITTTLEDNFCITTKGRETQLPIAFSIAPLSGKYSGIVIVIRDVTKDRELDEAKSGFISVASHQLRTPLTSIRWYSEMLLSQDAGPLNDSQKDFMNEIHGGAERLYQTVDLLLGISRVESGKLKTERTSINMNLFTGEITKELASQIDMKNLSLSVIPPDREPVIVWLDSLTLRQVILNLISNAIRYTNDHGIIEIKWWMGDEGREVVYMVHDNGIGIPEKERPRIFSKFFRAENARSHVPDGSGLGLALVKELVDSWGGKIWFDSAEGQGTTFFFTIPLTSTPTFK
ncbi:MAG: ATP-binding protein [Minisyncoccia bacterium]